MRYGAIVVVAVAGFGIVSSARGQHAGDIILRVNNDEGRIETGLLPEGGGFEPERVFEAEFGETTPNFTNEPGFDSDEEAFPVPSEIGFTFRRALREWLNDEFVEIPDERIQAVAGTLGPVLTPIDDTPVVGFTQQVSAFGQYHRHLGYTLLDPAGDGIYLLEMELWITVPQIGPSEPFWIVFNQNAPEEEHEAAVQWVRDNLLPPSCPADFDGDGFVTGLDFDTYVAAFEAGEASADFDGDGFITGLDFDAYVAAFEGGC